MTDHARQLAAILGLRTPTVADLPPMIETAAEAARGTDRGQPIAMAVIAALRATGIILPSATVIERVAIAGRARARKRAADALVTGLSAEHLTKLDRLLVVDPSVAVTDHGDDSDRILIQRLPGGMADREQPRVECLNGFPCGAEDQRRPIQ